MIKCSRSCAGLVLYKEKIAYKVYFNTYITHLHGHRGAITPTDDWEFAEEFDAYL
jgi:hypothetical protein